MFTGIHDSEVVAYLFDSRSEELVLSLAPGTGSATGDFRLIFGGVVAHQFLYPQLPSVVMGLVEMSVEELLRREEANLEEGNRLCGWPGGWYASLESGLAYCLSYGIRAFEIEQSYGMSGWVLAKSIRRLAGGL